MFKDLKSFFTKEKRKFLQVSIILFVFALIPVYFFIYNFHAHAISGTPQDWAFFAQYIGGTVGPMLAFANVCVLLFLYYRLFIFNRELAFNQLRHGAYIDITGKLNSLSERMSNSENGANKINWLLAEVQYFNSSMMHLFPGIDTREESENLENRLSNILKLSYETSSNQSDKADGDIPTMNNSILEFIKAKEAYLKMLRDLMIR